MNKDIKDIIQSFDLMLSDNKSVVNEVALISPLDRTSVNSKFGPRWGRLHNGVDLAANAIEVKSPADGVVEVGAIKNDSCGGTIIISHAGGFKTGFCHMQKITVKPGENVKQGDVIGISGGGKGDVGRGRSDGRHLHFTLRKDGKIVDPMDYINKTGVIMTGEVPKVTSTNDDASDSTDTTTTKPDENDIETKFLRGIAGKLGMKEDKEILKSFDLILNENKTFIDEVSATSSSLFGGSSVKIPTDGAHKGQSGWQSNNAWDIPTPIGSPVYAVADGVVVTFKDYGPTPIRKNNKTLFGAGFTVDSSNGLPDVYYTHLKDCKVNKGDSIKCGDLLGYVMDFPGSSYDHLHIGVESGHNIKEFLNTDGTLKCGGRISGDVSEPIQSTSDSDKTTSDVKIKPDEDDFETKFLRGIASKLGLKEEKFYSKLGDRTSSSFGKITIPSSDNSKIKSPVDGVVNNYHSESSCTNQITIQHNFEGRSYYLQFCNISEPQVRDGQRVSKGTVLGKTSSDVVVSLYNKGWERVNLEKMLNKEIDRTSPSPMKKVVNKTDVDKHKDKDKDYKKEKEYYDPYAIWFFNKVKEKMPSITKGGEPKISNFFNKYGLTGKKINENIERIKKLL
jgi:murein DD-endopeptidase MepM/ murein hydrolase activator NlpD